MANKITSIYEFISYIKTILGDPVIRVDDITDAQMEICIDTAVKKFHDEAAGYGTFESVLAIPVSGHIGEYDVPDTINSMVDSFDMHRRSGIGVLFSYQNLAYNRGLYQPYPHTLTLQMWWEQIRTTDVLYGTKYTCVFREYENKVVINPTPQEEGLLYFTVNEKVPDVALYNNEWVRDYTQALAKIQIGRNRSKYEGITLPGGGTINGQVWKDEGQSEKEKLEEELYSKWSEPPDFAMG